MHSHIEILEFERVFNRNYIEAVRRRGGDFHSNDIPRNSQFLNPTWGRLRFSLIPGPLVGRVAFRQPDITYGSSIYFGPHGISVSGFQVVTSPAAPASDLFYSKELGTHLDFPEVIGRRTFVSSGLDILEYFDDGDTSILNFQSTRNS